MAKLNSQLLHFAAATTAATLTTSRKLIRNFSYYRNYSAETESVCREELQSLCKKIRMDAFGLHNLLRDEKSQHSPFMVSLAGEINDSLEELHRKLLFFDADPIAEIIPVLDRERKFWLNYTSQEFYGKNLAQNLETVLPNTVLRLEETIRCLPPSSYL